MTVNMEVQFDFKPKLHIAYKIQYQLQLQLYLLTLSFN